MSLSFRVGAALWVRSQADGFSETKPIGKERNDSLDCTYFGWNGTFMDGSKMSRIVSIDLV